MSRKTIILAAATVLAALALIPSQASADTLSVRNSAEITIPASGPASVYPSTVGVRNLRGPVTDIQVTLNGVTHTRPRDLDLMLMAPDGTASVFMSDACGEGDVSNKTWTFHSTGDSVGMPEEGCPGLDYLPTNFGYPDAFPGTNVVPDRFTDWHRKVLTGQWKLYVVDDEAGESGKIARGWALTITTGPVDAFVPGTGALGPASIYPLTVPFAGPPGEIITDVDVDLGSIEHDRAADLDLLLAGPGGETAVLMSDACGRAPIAERLSFNDESPFSLPEGESFFCRGDVTPSAFDPGDTFPAPAPAGPYGTALSEFDHTDPTGEWRLYAVDDDASAEGGYFYQRFKLSIATRPRAAVAFTVRDVAASEGTSRQLTLTRSADGDLGPGSVTVASAPGSASSGADFAAIRQTLEFAPGQSTRTITLDVPEDAVPEPTEGFAVTLGNPTGDARVGSPARADVTIAADAVVSKAVRCGGRQATIVGTKRADVLRGTKRADVIAALAGSDTIRGARGNDVVCAGRGNDRVAGAAGRDRLLGGPGRDRLTGGKGFDRCIGGRGRDRVLCG